MFVEMVQNQEIERFINRKMKTVIENYCNTAKENASKNQDPVSISSQVIANKIANNDIIENVIHFCDENSRVCLLQGNLISGKIETILKATFTDFECTCEDYSGNETSYSDEWFDVMYKITKSDRLISSNYMSRYHKHLAEKYNR